MRTKTGVWLVVLFVLLAAGAARAAGEYDGTTSDEIAPERRPAEEQRPERPKQEIPRFRSLALMVEFRVAGAATLTGGGGGTAVPSLVVGVRLINRLQLGLGFSFLRTVTGAGVTDTANNFVTFVPTASIDIFQSRDMRFAFYGKVALPLGVAIACAGDRCGNSFVLGYDLSIGGRFLLHRHFALGLESGSAGLFVGVDQGSNNQVITWYGALVGTTYF